MSRPLTFSNGSDSWVKLAVAGIPKNLTITSARFAIKKNITDSDSEPGTVILTVVAGSGISQSADHGTAEIMWTLAHNDADNLVVGQHYVYAVKFFFSDGSFVSPPGLRGLCYASEAGIEATS